MPSFIAYVTGDVGCETVRSRGIAIRTAAEIDGLATTTPATESTRCESKNNVDDLGTLTLIPSGDEEDVALEVVLGVDRPTKDCRPPLDIKGCIVARRRFSFVRHQSLRVPIVLNRSCVGVLCGPNETCDRAACVSATVPNCPDGNCDVDSVDGSSNVPPSGDADSERGTSPDGPFVPDILEPDVTVPTPCGPDFCEPDQICCKTCAMCWRGSTCPRYCP